MKTLGTFIGTIGLIAAAAWSAHADGILSFGAGPAIPVNAGENGPPTGLDVGLSYGWFAGNALVGVETGYGGWRTSEGGPYFYTTDNTRLDSVPLLFDLKFPYARRSRTAAYASCGFGAWTYTSHLAGTHGSLHAGAGVHHAFSEHAGFGFELVYNLLDSNVNSPTTSSSNSQWVTLRANLLFGDFGPR